MLLNNKNVQFDISDPKDARRYEEAPMIYAASMPVNSIAPGNLPGQKVHIVSSQKSKFEAFYKRFNIYEIFLSVTKMR